MKPVIGITMGDAAGIGPELILKTLNDNEVFTICKPVVIGDYGVLKKINNRLNSKKLINDLNLVRINSVSGLGNHLDSVYPDILIYDDFNLNLENVKDLDQVEMYDMQGRLIQTWHTNFNYLPLNNLPKGVYILKAYTPEKMYVNKLVYAKE